MIDPLIQHWAALFITALMGVAALGKFSARDEFEGVVANYRVLPSALVRPFSLLLPFVEMTIALLVIVPATRVLGAAAAGALLSVFTLAIIANLMRGRRNIDCGCFRSAHRQTLSWWLVGRNAVLILFVLLLFPSSVPRTLGWLDVLQLPPAVAAMFLLYIAATGIWLPRPPTFDENYARSAGLSES